MQCWPRGCEDAEVILGGLTWRLEGCGLIGGVSNLDVGYQRGDLYMNIQNGNLGTIVGVA